MKSVIMFVVSLLIAAVPVYGDVYTYRDASGNVAYVDDLGKVPVKYRSRATLLEEGEPLTIIDSGPAAPARGGAVKRAAGKTAEKKRFDGTIELYVTSWCPVCVSAESYVKQKGYPYVKYDIEKDSAAKKRNDGYPGRGVPLVVVGEKNFRGFSGDTLEYYMTR